MSESEPSVIEHEAGATPPASEARRARDDFAARLKEVEGAARDWGIRHDLPEGRLISALMAAVEWTGRVGDAAQSEFKALFAQNRETAELELARAKELTKSAGIALQQARNAQIAVAVQQENAIALMVENALPLFIKELKGVLVLREKRRDSDIQRRRFALAGAVTLALFLGGYAVRTWQDADTTGALEQCLAHPLQANGHIYCDVTRFAQAAQ